MSRGRGLRLFDDWSRKVGKTKFLHFSNLKRILINEKYHQKVHINSFHLDGCTLGFGPQTEQIIG